MKTGTVIFLGVLVIAVLGSLYYASTIFPVADTTTISGDVNTGTEGKNYSVNLKDGIGTSDNLP